MPPHRAMPSTAHRSDVAVLLRTEHAVGRALSAAAGEDDAYRQVLGAIGRSLGCTAGAAWAARPGGQRRRQRVATWDAGGGAHGGEEAGEGLAGRAWIEGRPVCSTDGPGACFAFPVAGDSGVLAVLAFALPRSCACDEDLLAGLESLGTRIGERVERDRSQRALRESEADRSAILAAAHASGRRLRRLADEQAALRRVATAVASGTDPQRLFGLVTEEVGRLLGAQTANMVRFHGDDTATVVGGWSAGGARNVPVGGTVAMDGETASALVWRTGRPARIDDYAGLTGTLAQTLRDLGFRSAVAAPVFLGGRLWGAMIVSSVAEPFPAGAEQRVSDFSALAAQALANAQAHEELAASRARIVEAGDAERRRLERNLHDGAQQRLVSLSLTLGLAARRAERDAELRALLERARQDLGEALEELRELARGIHPAVLTDRGLEPALQALAARAPLPVELSVTIPERLPEAAEAAVYYVVAEALTNAARHAQASRIRVAVGCVDGHARVEVGDDGIGGASDGTSGLGSGLRGLADRVEALGGRLSLDSPAGGGTTLRASLPPS